MTNAIIEAIYSRRVTRFFTDCPIVREDLETIVQAGRWSPAGGNRRLQRFLVITKKAYRDIAADGSRHRRHAHRHHRRLHQPR